MGVVPISKNTDMAGLEGMGEAREGQEKKRIQIQDTGKERIL